MTQAASCPFCASAQTRYLESERWHVLRHADPVPVAGWMVLATRAHRAGPHALDPVEAEELGTILAALAGAVRAETGCERTYTISFNEAVQHLHLHVIPRHLSDESTKSWALADTYRETARGDLAPADAEDAERAARSIARRALPALARLGFVDTIRP